MTSTLETFSGGVIRSVIRIRLLFGYPSHAAAKILGISNMYKAVTVGVTHTLPGSRLPSPEHEATVFLT